MNHPLIELKEIEFSYPDGTKALCGVSCSLKGQESVALIGANGAGKSTLLSHLNGVHFSGDKAKGLGLFLNGDYLEKRDVTRLRDKVGMVFQNPDDQLFMVTVFEDVAFGLRNLGIDEENVEKRVMQALSDVGMLHLKDRSPHRLSGGEKRLVSISTILVMEPEVLVLDEPSSNLDPRSRRLLIQLLNRLDQVKVIATHDLDLVLDVCERTIILKDGVIQADGPTYEIMRDRALLEACHLEQPMRILYESRE